MVRYIALKSNETPEPIKKYQLKNKKSLLQINMVTEEVIKIWDSIVELADHIKISKTVASSRIQRHQPFEIDGIMSIIKLNT